VPLLQVVAVGAAVPKAAVVLANLSQVKLVLLVAPSLRVNPSAVLITAHMAAQRAALCVVHLAV
tara:strand:+ start:102 stop:293 length:192 start_codon:yes stop_codon:yes gene_type:complete